MFLNLCYNKNNPHLINKKMQNEKPKMFVSKDITLVATLITLEFRVESTDFQYEGDKPRPVGYFTFKETPQLLKAKDDFWQKRLSVEPISFMTTIRSIKAQLASVYKAPYYHDFDKKE